MNLLVTAACPKRLSLPAPPERLFLRRRRYLMLSLCPGEQLGISWAMPHSSWGVSVLGVGL